jgi:hypothetical protein
MIIRNQELVQLYGFFKNAVEASDLSFGEKRKMMKLVRLMQDDVDLVDKEREKLIREYAKYDDNGQMITNESGIELAIGTVEEFRKKMNELMMYEADLDLGEAKYKFNEKVFDGIMCTVEAVEIIDKNFLED